MNIRTILENLILDKETKQEIKFLKQLPIFQGLTDRAMSKLMTIMYKKKYPVNEIIFKEGDIGKAVFIIKSGEVIITKSGKEEKILSKLSSGDFFGEMALLEEMTRSATAKTTHESEILFIYKVRFDALLEHYPSAGAKVIYNLAKILSARLRQTSEEYVSKIF